MPLNQDVINLYDAFTHGQLSRRAFMERLTRMAGGAAAASAMLGVLANDYARAALVAEDDARLASASQTCRWKPVPEGRRGTVKVRSRPST